jgi:hypothetical protein
MWKVKVQNLDPRSFVMNDGHETPQFTHITRRKPVEKQMTADYLHEDEEEAIEEFDAPELDANVADLVRWKSRGPITKTEEVEERGTTYSKTHVLAESIKHIPPGFSEPFLYDTLEEARREQVLLDTATVQLGWSEDGTRAYKSKIKGQTKPPYRVVLTVYRLKEPVPKTKHIK